MATGSELPINEGASALQMAQTIFGNGVTITGASYTGWSQSSGIYSNGDSVAPGVTPGDTGVILSTGRASHITQSWGDPNRSNSTSTNTRGPNNDPDFNAAAGTRTYDASFMEVDFIPTGDTMTMQFVFASEEYPEYVNSLYQDFVGVWINGTQVELTVGDGDSDPGNINASDNQNLFISNTNDDYNTEMDGFTVTMTLKIPVNSGVENSIKIGIADVSDSSYDSNLLIAANSLQTRLVAEDDDAHLTGTQTKTIDVLDNDANGGGGTLTITHINGLTVVAGDVITLPTGQTVQLNADGSLTLVGDGTDEDFNFTYQIDNGTDTDVAFVHVDAVPCFTAGTMILTPRGEVPIETLRPGDLVVTQDNGAQPLRWIGQRTVPADGNLAPIHIRANALGRHGDLTVSPQHRILIRDPLAELLFGTAEVLVAAKHLVNGRSIRQLSGGDVTYMHLLLDRHEILYGDGLASESFFPGQQLSTMFEQEALAEITTIFPELDPQSGEGYGPPARVLLRGFEIGALMGRAA